MIFSIAVISDIFSRVKPVQAAVGKDDVESRST
jgi:hypothetical protein